MTAPMNIFINAARNACRMSDEFRRRSEARRNVKMFVVPRDAAMSDRSVPDNMVTDSMIDRYLAIEPPVMRGTTKFDTIIEEIERAYVLGLFFSALSAAVVTIERMLNTARIRLHEHATPKVKELWNNSATNDWQPNIDALANWGFLSDDLATELSQIYEIRCRYLHSGDISTVEADSFRAINAAYRLLGEIVGFPSRLFRWGNSGIECLSPEDPLVKVFYTPNVLAS